MVYSPDRIVPIATNIPDPQIINHHEYEVGFGGIFSICDTLSLNS